MARMLAGVHTHTHTQVILIEEKISRTTALLNVDIKDR